MSSHILYLLRKLKWVRICYHWGLGRVFLPDSNLQWVQDPATYVQYSKLLFGMEKWLPLRVVPCHRVLRDHSGQKPCVTSFPESRLWDRDQQPRHSWDEHMGMGGGGTGPQTPSCDTGTRKFLSHKEPLNLGWPFRVVPSGSREPGLSTPHVDQSLHAGWPWKEHDLEKESSSLQRTDIWDHPEAGRIGFYSWEIWVMHHSVYHNLPSAGSQGS